MLPSISGEFGVTAEPQMQFSQNGKPWAKIRGVAKDRKYNADKGQWEESGEPCFLDIIVAGKMAENIVESVTTGDVIVVTGTLQQREWEKDGQKNKAYSVLVTNIGVSVRFGAAPTVKMRAEGGTRLADMPDMMSAAQPEAAPF